MDDMLGGNLKRLRQDKGLTQMALAQAAGVARETISRIETGIRYPRADTVLNLCAALGCGPNDLYGYEEGGRDDDVEGHPRI